MASSLRMISHSSEETRQVGACLGSCATEGDVFLLSGNLGAGKTCLTQGIATGLGVQAYTRSPSFVIATRYQGRLTLHHIDLYRLEDPLEVWDLALDEIVGREGVSVVEWAEHAADQFSVEYMWIALDYGTNPCDRSIEFTSAGSRYEGHLAAVRERFALGKP